MDSRPASVHESPEVAGVTPAPREVPRGKQLHHMPQTDGTYLTEASPDLSPMPQHPYAGLRVRLSDPSMTRA